MDSKEKYKRNFVYGYKYEKCVKESEVHLTETSELRVNPYDNSDFVYRGKIKCKPQD